MKRLIMFLVLSLVLCGCTPSEPVETETQTKFTSQGMILSIPNEYKDLLIVETKDGSDQSGVLFYVHEKASVEASRELWPDDETMVGGFLFGIGHIDETAFRQGMMAGMTGMDVFARDKEGHYYVYYHPTDVQLVRVGEYTEADWEQWGRLCEWADIKSEFLADNPELTAYERTYSDVDGVLHYIAYGDGTIHLTRKGGDAVYAPERADAMPYLEQLLDDVMYYSLRDGDIDPEGDYISLSAPEWFSHVSFDFFIGEGQQQVIRQNYLLTDDIAPIYYVATKDGEEFPAGAVMVDWLNALS